MQTANHQPGKNHPKRSKLVSRPLRQLFICTDKTLASGPKFRNLFCLKTLRPIATSPEPVRRVIHSNAESRQRKNKWNLAPQRSCQNPVGFVVLFRARQIAAGHRKEIVNRWHAGGFKIPHPRGKGSGGT